MAHPETISLFFARKQSLPADGVTVLAGDVGGTKTNLALFNATADSVKCIHEVTYPSADFPSCTDALKKYLSESGNNRPDRICLGVAGPVMNGKVNLTNLSWKLDSREILAQTGVKEVTLINDLEATAYGLEGLQNSDIINIHSGEDSIKGNMAILAPGTGLGEAGLFWDGQYYHPFSTEGGHSEFSPRSRQDIDLLLWLQKKYNIVSWEKLVAGPGIHDIFLFLSESLATALPDWLTDALKNEDPSSVISHAAMEKKERTCVATMDLFITYLARECASLVLKLKATGGLFLGGGIPPKIAPLIQTEDFYRQFLDCDRMQGLLKLTPINILMNSNTAIIGAAWFGAFGAAQ